MHIASPVLFMDTFHVLCSASILINLEFHTLGVFLSIFFREDILGTQVLSFFPLRMFLYRLFNQIYNYNLSYIFSLKIKVFQNYILFLVRSQSLLISFLSPVSNRHFPPDFSF